MTFSFELEFIDLPSVGTIVISEMQGFDKAGYKVKQDDSRFGRDTVLVCEDTELTFSRSFFENIAVTQMLPNGQLINHASLGFDFLLDIFQNNGWESEVNLRINKDGVLFSLGILDMATAVVEFDNIKVKIIQNTNREIIKRLQDTDVNAFNDKALDDREITPCSTTNILLKAKPINQFSNWKYGLIEPTIKSAAIFGLYYNYANSVIDSNIENTISYIQGINGSSFNDFKYVFAQNDLSNVVVKITNLNNLVLQSTGLYISYGVTEGTATNILLDTATASSLFDTEYTVNLPNLRIGESIWIYFKTNTVSNGTSFYSMDINITATSTAIDTVVKGVRLIDLVKHNAQSMADVTVDAPDYDLGGEHYNNFAFNGLLLGQITDKPFNNKFKDLITFTKETCSDYQINESSIEILPYAEFYNDIEMASFDELPSFTTSTKTNKRYSLKTAEFKYKRSSDQRQNNSQNSIDDVHTETQKFITDKVDGNLKVEIDHIRSAFLLEEARRRAFDNEQTKSLQNDDNLFLLKCIPLAPSSQGGFGAVLLMQINDDGHLQILNNNTDGDGIPFNWNLLGFNVGSQFFIDSGENVGTWQVLEITNSVLTLFPISVSATFEGEAYITMRWFFTDVLLTNQTDEGFTVIEGIENPTNYSNLEYHWARNIQRWNGYLATATKFKPDGIIKTASFKTNGDLVTRKDGESANVVDSADIVNSEIASQKILTPFIHSIKVYADLNTMTQLIDDVQSVKGYCTFNLNDGRTIKGHIKEMDYTFINEELDVEVEERFIGDFMEITDGLITYPNYQEKNNLNSFQINNNLVALYDTFDVQMYPATRFTKIKINGVQFTDVTAFTDALISLIG
jgi:hypothetical protein